MFCSRDCSDTPIYLLYAPHQNTIGANTQYFNDGGKKVVAAIENEIATAEKNVLNNSSENDIINISENAETETSDSVIRTDDSVTEMPEIIKNTPNSVSEEKTNSKKTNELFKKLTNSIPLLENDAIVYVATGNEFETGEKKLSQQVYEYFESLGGIVHRENFGDVAINDKGVDSSIAHGMGRAKAIAFASVPAVIEKGRQIDFVENWKGRNYDSYVFAAPIQIGTQRAFVGVVVTKSGTDNRYYLHEVSDSEGNIIIIKKDDVSFKSKSEADNDTNSLGETSSTNSIVQKDENVNKVSANNGDVSYSIDSDEDSQDGVMWTLNEGTLSKSEVATFYEKLSEMHSNKYRNYKLSQDGDYIFAINNKLVYADGDYDYPTIYKVVTFFANDENLIDYARECFYEGETVGRGFDVSKAIAEAVLGEETVRRADFTFDDYYQRGENDKGKGTDSETANQASGEDVSYSIESEDIYGQNRSILSDGDRRRNSGESGEKSSQKVDGRTSHYKEGRKTSYERRKYCEVLRAAGHTQKEIISGHKCEVIPEEHYNDRMRKLVAKNKSDGIDRTVIITGKAELPYIKKFARGVLIRGNGKTTMIIQWDNALVMPEQISDHEKIHRDYKTERVQVIKNIFKNSLSVAQKNEIMERLSYLYNGVIEGNEDKIFEEFIADVLSGMDTFGYSRIYQDLVNAYWDGNDVFIDRFRTAEYSESIDAGGDEGVLDGIGFGDEYSLSGSGEINGYEQSNYSKELGWLKNSGKNERLARVDSVGQIQSKKSDTPHTKRVHRSGVSAETLTSSGLTAEQASLRAQDKLDGFRAEFYTEAKIDGVQETDAFNTEHTAYYPDAAFGRNDISIKNGIASFTEKRFNDLIEEFSVPVGGQLNRDYAKGYVAYISPSDFLSLTTVNEQRIINDTKSNEKYGNGKLDIERLSNNTQTPYLEIDFEDGIVTAHEGRHRMVMLRDAGVERVAIVVKDINPESGKYHTKKMTDISVTGQEFSIGTASGKVTIREIIPLSPNYRNEVREKFVDISSDISYSVDLVDEDIAELTPERKREILEDMFNRDKAQPDKKSGISREVLYQGFILSLDFFYRFFTTSAMYDLI